MIVVAHGGTRITFHSLHDGAVLKSISLRNGDKDAGEQKIVSHLWWVETKIPKAPEAFKDVFDRKEIVSVLFTLCDITRRFNVCSQEQHTPY